MKKSNVILERFTEGTLQMMVIMLYLYTNYVQNNEAQLIFCFTYIGGIAMVFVINIGFIVKQGFDQYLRQKYLK